MNMKTKLKLFSTALFAIFAAAAMSQAQSSTTNVLQSVNVAFTVYSEGASSHTGTSVTTKIVSGSLTGKQLVTALGANLSVNFSSAAFLALDKVVGSGDGSSLVVVDGNTITPVPSSLISFTNIEQLAASVENATGVTTSESDVDFISLTINLPNSWSFTATGLETANQVDVKVGTGKSAETVHVGDATVNISGSGTEGASATIIIVTGKITTTYTKTLVTTSAGSA